jgi:hypothetical protein
MLRWTKRQWELLADQLSALANLAAAALIFEQLVSGQPFSWGNLVSGFIIWLVLTAFALLTARKETQ